MNTQTNPTIAQIQADTFYAIYNNAEDISNCTYNIVKVIKMAHTDENGHKLKVCQYADVFKRLPNLVYAEQLGEASAQYWLEVDEFMDWQPIEVAVIESASTYSFYTSYPLTEDEWDWVA